MFQDVAGGGGGDVCGKEVGIRMSIGLGNVLDDPLWATHSNPKALFSKLLVTFTGKVSITAAWGTLEGVKQRSFNQGS